VRGDGGICLSLLSRIVRMSQSKPERQIDYIELPASDIARTKQFYENVFGWKFEDYGPDYTSFFDGRMAGGFTTDRPAPAQALLVVIYASDLAAFQEKIKSAGGKIVKDTFSFPGGRRFHFLDPNGNELAVWSDAP
jgi:predicted enzyme related to lactoylglutathione lyase